MIDLHLQRQQIELAGSKTATIATGKTDFMFRNIHTAYFSETPAMIPWKIRMDVFIISYWRHINVGSGNNVVSSGNRPLRDPMLTYSYDAIWR